MRTFPVSVVLICAVTSVVAQSFTVVPSIHLGTDAVAYECIAGAAEPMRQQTLIGTSHLTGLVGRTLTAIEFRRTAAAEVFVGGAANLTVTMSHSPRTPLAASPTYADNVGLAGVQVFQGTVVVPTSPATAGPGTAVAWTNDNIVRIPLTTPFLYTGGTLLVDVAGQPVAGQGTNWWMADAIFDDILGTAVEVGPGCGPFGGPQHRWSGVDVRTLLLGAHAKFWAFGPANEYGIAVFGATGPTVPLTAIGLPLPQCSLSLGTLDAMMIAQFLSASNPLAIGSGSIAEVRVGIPNNAGLLGVTLTTQWIDLSSFMTSNAMQWSVAASVPMNEMTLVEGSPSELAGQVHVHLAHVLRFEHN